MVDKKLTSEYLLDEYLPVNNEKIGKDWIIISSRDDELVLKEISGTFLMNSSNPQFKPEGLYHWFDGDGFIHAVKFEQDEVYYKCNFIYTKKYLEEKKAHKNINIGLRNPINKARPVKSIYKLINYLLKGINPFEDTSNTDLVFHHNKLLSLWFFCGEAYQINLDNLETLGVYQFENPKTKKPRLKNKISAHPKICPITGEMFFFDFSVSWKRFQKSYIDLYKVSRNGDDLWYQKVFISGAKLWHDLAITRNYIVLIDIPIEMGIFGMRHNKNCPTRFGILKRDSFSEANSNNLKTTPIWFEDRSSCSILHVVNAYEQNHEIVIEALRKPNFSIVSNNEKDESINSHDDVDPAHAAYLHRWVLNLASQTIDGEQGSGDSLREYVPFAVEFPTINPNKYGIKNKFSYLATIASTETFKYDGFVKYNHEHQISQLWKFDRGEYCSEVRFVPSPQGEEEDRGWLMTFVYDSKKDTEEQYPSRLDIFDAQNIEKGAIASLVLPHKIPIGFHTLWVEQSTSTNAN